VGGITYGGYNRALKRQAKRRPNLVMLRWRRMVRRHPEWLAGDGVHVSAQGYEARARAYARAARTCA
jgi:lysophospholipase L1-like esterase